MSATDIDDLLGAVQPTPLRSLTADEWPAFYADATSCRCGHERSSHSATEPTGGCYACPDSGPKFCTRFAPAAVSA